MTYVEQTLVPGEVIQLECRISLRQYLPRFAVAALAIIFAVIILPGSPLPRPDLIGVVVAAWVLSTVGSALVAYRFTEIAITNRRVVAKVGVISRQTIEIELPKIEAVRVEQGILGRILGYGSLVISGTGGSREVLPAVDDPIQKRKALAVVMSPIAGSA